MNMVFYESSNHFYGEFANIRNGKISKYQPISLKGLESFVKKIKKSNSQDDRLNFKSIIPSNVLHFDSGALSPTITWYCESKMTELNILKKSGQFHYPTLVFQLRNNEFYIYAAATNNVTAKTKLYKAPFPNIYEDNHLCFGNMNIKNFVKGNDYEKIMKSLESAFYGSTFTAEIMGGQPTKSGTVALIEGLLNSEQKFPKKELISINKTVSHVLS